MPNLEVHKDIHLSKTQTAPKYVHSLIITIAKTPLQVLRVSSDLSKLIRHKQPKKEEKNNTEKRPCAPVNAIANQIYPPSSSAPAHNSNNSPCTNLQYRPPVQTIDA